MKNSNVVILPPCVVATLRRACKKYFPTDRDTFAEKVGNSVRATMEKHNIKDEDDMPVWQAVLAYIFSYYELHFAIEHNMNIRDIVRNYAEFKKAAYYNCSDFGAFGDLLEVLTRLAIRKNINLAHIADIHVKRAFESDITSSKYGKMEVGHNGKSFNESLENLETIIYGVFSDDDKLTIFDTCINGEIQTAIDVTSELMYFFTIPQFIETLSEKVGRAKKFKINSRNQLQIVFNESMMNAFIKYMEGQDDIKTLAETIK